jgi:tRNA(Arg) A34 adenosine deaminase TadA
MDQPVEAPFLDALVREALDGMREGFDQAAGLRPFGAVLAKDGVVIAKASNSCVRDTDPTAHAEVNVIRMGARTLNRLDLSDCVLVASAQPCPMCRAAAFHAGIQTIVYVSSWSDYRDLFPDHACFEAMATDPDPSSRLSPLHRPEALAVWQAYRQHRSDHLSE